MQAEGIRVAKKRVARLMKEAGLQDVSRRKRPSTTIRKEGKRPAPDLIERDFTAEEPDRLWVADISYVPTQEGHLYLAVVVDAYNRKIVGWEMASHLQTELVLEALNMAARQREPEDASPKRRFTTPIKTNTFVRLSVHRNRLWRAVQGRRSAALNGVVRRLLRQRDVRKLLRDARM